MEIICRQCEGNAFRILPEDLGIVTVECVVCGTLTFIEIPKLVARSSATASPRGHRSHPANGRRHDGPAPGIALSRP